ncbi:hypothetical protein [Psychroflexus aestuariivivens]|uniref:hypothetical protein n=1 Tax=Psychroflexus aestuariivivens TaxID=1795040 RepID=UPI000FD70D06|nr:hypothetical protein [Psychroflexus aestuariivivens]
MKIKIILSLIIVVLVLSCKSFQKVSEEKQTTKIDTVFVEKKVNDTMIIKEVKEVTKPVYFETEIPCDEDQSGKVGTGNNIFDYKIKDGKVQFDFHIDSTKCLTREQYRSQFKSDSLSIRKQLEKEYRSQKKTKVYVYPWWVWALGVGCILFAGLWTYQKFFIPRI